MSFASSTRTDRVRAGVATVIVQAALGYALITGLVVRFPQSVSDPLKLFLVSPPPPPPKALASPSRETVSRPQGTASPPNLRATATPIVVPPPVVLIPVPPQVIVAEEANAGGAPISGASTVIGPGTGSGGAGDGSGSGGAGNGDGSGGAPLRKIGGRITGNDYPRGPFEAGIGGTLFVRYIVGIRGRVTACSITRSSGNAELDQATCRLITERFRFKPRRNAAGTPVAAVITEDHTWVVDRVIENQIDERH
jgi:protein TonB